MIEVQDTTVLPVKADISAEKKITSLPTSNIETNDTSSDKGILNPTIKTSRKPAINYFAQYVHAPI